uniref:Acylphosphatase n=1 Tax=Agrobacterium albertimagni TaxID=147266 RepID=A0A7C1T266_9HYPH
MTVGFTFSGRLEPQGFVAFAEHRAARLSLGLKIAACDHERCRLTLSGPEALIDAFEMAVSLGPYDSIVLDVTRFQTNADLPVKAAS